MQSVRPKLAAWLSRQRGDSPSAERGVEERPQRQEEASPVPMDANPAPTPQPTPQATAQPTTGALGAEVSGLSCCLGGWPAAPHLDAASEACRGSRHAKAGSAAACRCLPHRPLTRRQSCLRSRRCPQASVQSLDGKPIPASFVCPVSMEIMVRPGPVGQPVGAPRARPPARPLGAAHQRWPAVQHPPT